MSRTVVGYIPGGFLNSAATTSTYGVTDSETGAALPTGLALGQQTEYTDAEALGWSVGNVVAVNILTAGSGQTNGTYTATASTGGAVISYTISGNALTAVSLVSRGAPGVYNATLPNTAPTVPTFTIAAGGTPGTVQAVVGQLYSGVYEWAQLDPAVAALIPVGTALYWLQTGANSYVVTNVASGNAPDYAGVSIDPNFGPANVAGVAGGTAGNYAFIQVNGKQQVAYASSGTVPTTFGDVIQITSAAAPTTFNAVAAGNAAAALSGLTVGYALAAAAVSSVGLIRNTRSVVRF